MNAKGRVVMVLGLLIIGAAVGFGQSGKDIKKEGIRPGPENFEQWLEFIRPTQEERAWEGIGWRNAFMPAVEEARRLGRPILLWTMNGHPLGCT